MISIQHLSKSFGKKQILHDISLDIADSKVTALIGPNGSGKTTLIKSVLGLVKTEKGTSIFVGDSSVLDEHTRTKIGYMPQIPQFPPHMTVEEIISFVQKLRKTNVEPDLRLIDDLKLQSELKKPFRTLSGGNKQKVSAVLAFLFNPEVLILDEPTSGLDPISTLTLKKRIREEAQSGKTIIYISHIIQEIEELADELVYLQQGRIHLQLKMEDFLANHQTDSFEQALAAELSKTELVHG